MMFKSRENPRRILSTTRICSHHFELMGLEPDYELQFAHFRPATKAPPYPFALFANGWETTSLSWQLVISVL
jgi:hypothetical protein